MLRSALPGMDRASDLLEAPMHEVLEELESFLREARSPRALAAIGPDASLERDLGLGSLERVELLSRLESRFRKRAPERTLGEAETPRDLAQAFRGAAESLPDAEGKSRREATPRAGRTPRGNRRPSRRSSRDGRKRRRSFLTSA